MQNTISGTNAVTRRNPVAGYRATLTLSKDEIMKSTSFRLFTWNPVAPFSLFFVVMLLAVPLEAVWANDDFEFRVMTWNIWHGGREDGVVEVATEPLTSDHRPVRAVLNRND